MKEINPIAARRNTLQHPFDPVIDNTILIDTTLKSPDETILEVLSKLDFEVRRPS